MRWNNRTWPLLMMLFLVAQLVAPPLLEAGGGGKGGGGGVCSPRPKGCKKEECRCENKTTCKKCRQFVCRRGKKKPIVVCRPCCKDKKGKLHCLPPPKMNDRKCVQSPS